MRRTNTAPLSEILRDFITKNKLEDGIDNVKINNIWEDVTGKYIANSTKNMYVHRNKLFVNIQSPILRNEIMIIKSELVKRINNKIGRKYIDEIIISNR